jgi:hypothetical protein
MEEMTYFEKFIAAGERARARKHANPMPVLPTGGGEEMRMEDGLIVILGAGAILGLLLAAQYFGWVNFV